MPRIKALITCAIACLVVCSCFTPASARISVMEDEEKPWSFGAGWSFTWMIDESTVPFERNTRFMFTVDEIQLITSGTTVVTRKLVGNLSRELDLGGGTAVWTLMKSLVSYAEFDVIPEVYSLTGDALGDNVLVLPMALTIPMWQFKIAYANKCSDTNWNITLDESALIFDARNKTSPDQRVRIDFNDKGIVSDLLTTNSNGTTIFHMYLESTYDPGSDLALLTDILVISSIGVAIAVVVALLFKKYKINPRDVVRGVKPARTAGPGDPEQQAENEDAEPDDPEEPAAKADSF